MRNLLLYCTHFSKKMLLDVEYGNTTWIFLMGLRGKLL